MKSCRYVPNPVLVIIDVQPKELGIPTKAYYAIEEVKEVKHPLCDPITLLQQHVNSNNQFENFFFSQNATQKSQKIFVHVPTEIAAHEVEEIGMLLLLLLFYFCIFLV